MSSADPESRQATRTQQVTTQQPTMQQPTTPSPTEHSIAAEHPMSTKHSLPTRSTPSRTATGAAAAVRAVTAALVLAALISSTVDAVRDGLLAQHLSYFTNQSNLFFAVLLVAVLAHPRGPRPAWLDEARGAVAFYLVMTGIIYALLVAPLDELLRWDIGWTGIVLHRLMPIAALLDWLLTPRLRTPSRTRLVRWQLYPVAFLALTWVRGGVTGWYPYAFLDPTASSWPQVLVTTVVVLAAFLMVAALVHLLEGRLRPAELPQREAVTAPR